jgi:hypothetical protein
MKKIILGLLADWGLNIVILVAILALTKVFSPIFVIVFIPFTLAYWTVVEAIRSGRILGISRTFSVDEKYMFSLTLAAWMSPALWIPITAISSVLKTGNNVYFWMLLPLSSISIYCILIFINPSLKKISKNKP